MQQLVDRTGRFAWRPFYKDGELDTLCEGIITSYMVEKAGQFSLPIPTDRLIALVERDADDLDLYADLSAEGLGVEGLTTFNPGAKPTVAIDEKLHSGGSREHRLRTTLAHEFGHVTLHDRPYQDKVQKRSLFEAAQPVIIKSHRDNIVGASKTDWMEWQAGYFCAALLMPKTHVLTAVTDYCDQNHCHGRIFEGTGYPGQVAGYISGIFQVSQQAALVRIKQLGLVQKRSTNLNFD